VVPVGAPFGCVNTFGSDGGKATIMEEFPIWLKVLIWIVMVSTVVYAVGAVLYCGFFG
jgi:hypothetical protein